MGNDEFTTIALKQKTKEKLEKLKVHPNQSFDEILDEILGKFKNG